MPKSFDFEVSLRGARPKVWRRFLLSTGASFNDLHEAIQRACGWSNYHLFLFRGVPTGVPMAGVPDPDGEFEVADASDVKLDDYFGQGRKRVEYEYDFGDGWIHDVKLLGVVEHEERRKRKLLGGARAFPHEDSGGMDGYLRCAKFVKTGRDPYGERDDEGLRRWLGGWHPDHFDFEATARKFDSKPPRRPAVVIASSRSALSSSKPHEKRTNAWCDALGIDVPDLAEVAQRKGYFGAPKLSELVTVLLLAEGRPLSDDEVVERLPRAGISTGVDLRTSLKRSLASSRAPLLRDHEGRLTVDLKSREMDLLTFSLGLKGPRPSREPEKAKAIETTSPLTQDEVDAAYKGRIAFGDTKARFMLAVLDAERRPMTFDELGERWVTLGGDAERFTFSNSDRALLKKRTDLVLDGETVRLVDDADLSTMREAIRKRARWVLEARERSAQHEAWKEKHETEERARWARAAERRRCVIVSRPSPEAPEEIDGFDFVRREARTFRKGELRAFGDWVQTFDIVAGARPVQTLGAAGVEVARFTKIIDLLPAQKTKTVDGRQIPITWAAIVNATLGPTADPKSLATMVALYRYALLHLGVWIVADGIGVELPVDAHIRGDRGVYQVMREGKEAAERGDTPPIVSFWVGHAPEVLPPGVLPLNAVVRGRVVDYDRGSIVLVDERGQQRVIAMTNVSSLDVTGGADFAWRLPTTWTT